MTVDEFKVGFKHYIDYLKREKELKNECEDIFYQMTGVKGIRYDKLPTSFNPSQVSENQLYLIDLYEQKNLEISYIQAKYKYFTVIIAKFTQEEIDLLYRLIIKKQSYDYVGREMGYSESGMHKMVERMIRSKL